MKKVILAVLLSGLFAMSAHAAKFYVNLSANYNHTKAGSSSSDALGGGAGLQRALDTCIKGDSILCYGTADMRKLQDILYDGATGTFARGDTITNRTGTGTAVIYQDSATQRLKTHILSGAFANNDSISTASGGALVNGAPVYPGIFIRKVLGRADSLCNIIGVDSTTYTNTGAMATLDGNTTTILCTVKPSANAHNYYWVQNIAFYRSVGHGFTAAASSNQNWMWTNCWFTNNGTTNSTGCNVTTAQFFDRCKFNYNLNTGCTASTSVFVDCEFIGNTAYGGASVGGTLHGCVFSGNSTSAIVGATLAVTLVNCIVDSSNTGALCNGSSLFYRFIKCKFTSNTTASINVATSASVYVYERQNIYLNNGNSNAINGTKSLYTTGESVYTGTIGYTNKATNNFSPTNLATGRRVTTNIGKK